MAILCPLPSSELWTLCLKSLEMLFFGFREYIYVVLLAFCKQDRLMVHIRAQDLTLLSMWTESVRRSGVRPEASELLSLLAW